MNDEARDFGQAVAKHLGRGPSERALAAQRANLLLKWHARRALRRPFPRVLWRASLALVIATAAVFVWRGMSPSAPALPDATWNGLPLTEGSTVGTNQSGGVLKFAGGSRIELEPTSQAYVSGVGSSHVEVGLERGRLEANIEKAPGAQWTIIAGPYRVHVVGTRFSVDWQPNTEAFSVAVMRGEVRVLGGRLPPQGVYVRTGGRLDQGSAERAAEDRESQKTARDEAPRTADAHLSPEQTRPTGPTAHHKEVLNSEKVRSSPPENAPSFQTLASQGKYEAALVAAEQLGMNDLLRRASAEDLQLLGNAARFAGRSADARRAYTALRERFPEDARARLAAFYLARLASDVDGAPQQAAQWLRVFLRESPTGDMAATARARLMDTLATLGDRKGAAAVAREYLRMHPKGPHNEVARSLLGSQPHR